MGELATVNDVAALIGPALAAVAVIASAYVTVRAQRRVRASEIARNDSEREKNEADTRLTTVNSLEAAVDLMNERFAAMVEEVTELRAGQAALVESERECQEGWAECRAANAELSEEGRRLAARVRALEQA